MVMTRADIARLIPHAGTMCLLDGVVRWDATQISCVSRTHLDPANPLRVGEELPAMCGVEYAAQTMAVHGGLAAPPGRRPRAGYLVALRDVICRRTRLDNLDDELQVDVAQLMGDQNRVIYQFALRAGATEILSGRATVILDAAA